MSEYIGWAGSKTPQTDLIWNAFVNAGVTPSEAYRILVSARRMELELNNSNDRIKRLERLLSVLSNGQRWEYKNGPEEYFAALRETWRLLEEKEP